MKTKRAHRIAGAMAGMVMMLGLAAPASGDMQVSTQIQIRPRPVADLQISVWPDRGEGSSYAIGDPIAMNVEVNRDCFLILYNIDTRGNLRILFPYDAWDDNFMSAGDVIRFPRPRDGYDWTVDGPAGIEYVQAIATEFPIDPPDWPVYMRSVNHGGTIDRDPELRDFRAGNDRLDYIGVVNRKITGRFWNWCATDLATFYVNPRYYQHVNIDYDPWPDQFYGEVYINWPIGASIHVDGVYIGIAPLWLPRHYYGQHVITCFRGDRLVRRHAFAFYPKRDYRPRIEGHDWDDIREHGYIKEGRRDGIAQFGDRLERYKEKNVEYRRAPVSQQPDGRRNGRVEQIKDQQRDEGTMGNRTRGGELGESKRGAPQVQDRRTAVAPPAADRRNETAKRGDQPVIPEGQPEQPRHQKEANPGWLRSVVGTLTGAISEGKRGARDESPAQVTGKEKGQSRNEAVASKPEKSKDRVGKAKQERSEDNGNSKREKRR